MSQVEIAPAALESHVNSMSNPKDRQKSRHNSKRKRDRQGIVEKPKAKRRKFEDSRKNGVSETEVVENINPDIGQMDSRLFVDHIAQKSKRFQPDLSLVELEQCYIPERAFVDTSQWSQPRSHSTLADFLEHFAGSRRKERGCKLSDASPEFGYPHTLVIAGAALRAAHLTRALRQFQTKTTFVTKLFAKHIKFQEAVATVKKTRITIGVGTPQRIIDLIEDGTLGTTSLETIVVDASYIDQKQRGILDMRETQIPLVQLLTRAEIKDRFGIAENPIRVLVF